MVGRSKSHTKVVVLATLFAIFFPLLVTGDYKVLNIKETNDYNIEADLVSENINDISPLKLIAVFETKERLRVKIFDPNLPRWEAKVDYNTLKPKIPTNDAGYDVKLNLDPFSFSVNRKADQLTLFDTSYGSTKQFNGLTFQDQYIEISTQLPLNPNIYGLGERTSSLKLNTKNITYSFWSFDNYGVPTNINGYGSHPFYLELRDGKAHGVFLLSSNGLDVHIDDKKLSYFVTGGILDFYFFMGSTPEKVIQQYTELIGRSFMPPLWALGFHQSKWGYQSLAQLEEVVNNFARAQIPLDTIWSDIDYMENYTDFTWNEKNFPINDVTKFISDLHESHQHYIVIIDAGINNVTGFPAFDKGTEMDIWIKDNKGQPLIGYVWPGQTVFTDFLHPQASSYWKQMFESFLTKTPVDGIWLDMNEIANFDWFLPNPPSSYYPYKLKNTLNNTDPLQHKTISIDAKHYGGVTEYNCHSLNGHWEVIATADALRSITNKRQMIITRSSFPGTGAYSGKWLGDNLSIWSHMSESIPGILTFQLFGIPMIGADICGFGKGSPEPNMSELCSRWMELGAFYPFSRNHNGKSDVSQEPYIWPEVASISRKVLEARYRIISYWYTLFFKSSTTGSPVLYPLFFEFPEDESTWDNEKQFLVGKNLLVTPILKEGANEVNVYFPKGKWYDFWTLDQSFVGPLNTTIPTEHILVHIRGGSIIPFQKSAKTTAETIKSPFSLIVALTPDGSASGELYVDDGLSIDSISGKKYTHVIYNVQTSGPTILQASYQLNNYPTSLTIETIKVLGITQKPNKITFQGEPIAPEFWSWNETTSVLEINSTLSLGNWKLTWSFVSGYENIGIILFASAVFGIVLIGSIIGGIKYKDKIKKYLAVTYTRLGSGEGDEVLEFSDNPEEEDDFDDDTDDEEDLENPEKNN